MEVPITLHNKFLNSKNYKEFINEKKRISTNGRLVNPLCIKGYEILKQRVANGENVDDIFKEVKGKR